MRDEMQACNVHKCGEWYCEENIPRFRYFPKNEETITMKLAHYEDIVSNLDKARREADFYKAQYEALKKELNEAQTALMKIEEVFVDGENTYEDWRTMGNIAREALEKQND